MMPLAADTAQRNVESQSQDPLSMLSYFRALTTLRQNTPALSLGDYAPVDTEANDIFAYTRNNGTDRVLVVLNFADSNARLDLSRLGDRTEILLSTYMRRTGKMDLLRLQVHPNEGLVLKI